MEPANTSTPRGARAPRSEGREEVAGSPCMDSGYSSFLEASTSPPSTPSTPTLEQALLLPLQDKREEEEWADLYTQHLDPDYDLAHLVRALRIKCGPPSPSPPSSPPPRQLAASPSKLFGALPRPLLPSSLPPLGRSTTAPPSAPPPPPPTPELLPSSWSGQLPQRSHRNPVFSTKMFLGGVPWDVTEAGLVQAFRRFGPIRIEWPGKDNSPSPPKGYVYIIFEQEESVPRLLAQCSHDRGGGASYFRLSSSRMRSKEVQIIPWVLADSNHLPFPRHRLDPQKTVFVGALHGMLNAEGLATIFHDLFGGVVYAGIDTDKHRYPIGSGRVTFDSEASYMRAVASAFVEIKCQKFCKKVQVDPYLEDALCSCCLLRQGPYFCRWALAPHPRDLACFLYYCRSCWEERHAALRSHQPLMRNTRSGGGPATRPTIALGQDAPAPAI